MGGATGGGGGGGIGGMIASAGSAAAGLFGIGGGAAASSSLIAGGTSVGFIPGISAMAGGGAAAGGGGAGLLAGLGAMGPAGWALAAGAIVGGLALGGVFSDKDYPYANATINVSNGGASVGSISTLDNGPSADVRKMAQGAADSFNNLIADLGVDPGSYSMSIGYVKPGRPGNLSGPYFAGIPGDFQSGATFEGLPDSQSAIASALEFMSGKSDPVRSALAARGIDVRAYETGGSGVFTRPSLLMVGEHGRPERVSVAPLSGGAGRGGGGVNVTVQGPMILDGISMNDFVRRIAREINSNQNRFGSV
jgi:hypothetical protein